jgi:hypothetical protein
VNEDRLLRAEMEESLSPSSFIKLHGPDSRTQTAGGERSRTPFRMLLRNQHTGGPFPLVSNGHTDPVGGALRGRIGDMRLGIAHHYGWAVAITASADHRVVDRRRIELIEPGLPNAPIHHEGGQHLLHRSGKPLDDNRLAALVADVRASVVRTASAALDELGNELPIDTISLRAWSADFPEDIAAQRRMPYESRADSVMYCKVLAELAHKRGWLVHTYNAKTVEDDAVRILGERANDVLRGPRSTLGPPWSKDHRMALAATIVAT